MPSEGDNGAQESRVYSRKEFAARIGRSVSTLRSWERKGLLKAQRYPSGRPFYTEAQLRAVLEKPE